MELLERIANTGGESIEAIVHSALESGDKDRLLSISDLLDKMSELELLQSVKEKLADLAKDNHGADSTEYAAALNNLAETYRAQVRFSRPFSLHNPAPLWSIFSLFRGSWTKRSPSTTNP